MNELDEKVTSRVQKNQKLYESINESSIDDFSVASNAHVIADDKIDIESIKKILDTRYKDAPKRRSIKIEEEKYEEPQERTKEYDLKVVLEQAKDEAQDTYEDDKGKKLKNTQYDILNNLNIETGEKMEDNPVKSSEEDLLELINTITINEAKRKEEDEQPDLLEQLKGDDNTEVFESMKEEVKTVTTIIKEDEPEKIDESFYTTSNLIKDKDLEDENDFVDDNKLSIGIKILIVLVVICFIVGIVLFLKTFLNK